MPNTQTDTHQKALTLNLNPKIYGTIAEIGAGQEVSRWFFHVGGAAGTVAKTISAYDMVVSDQLYGKGSRYVSRDRVQAMLEREFSLLQERLGETRGDDTSFFAFADSVAARNYAGTNECHGWLGLCFQTAPRGKVNTVLLHVNMLNKSNQLQQEAVGILGVNLIYGAYFKRKNIQEFLLGLIEDLEPGRIEVDTLYCAGPEFETTSAVTIGSLLVVNDMAKAVLFNKEGALEPPTEIFHNRPLLALRSRIERPIQEFHQLLLSHGVGQLNKELKEGSKAPVSFLETSISSEQGTQPTAEEVGSEVTKSLNHCDRLLLTRIREHYLLTDYVRRYAPVSPIRFVLGVSSLVLLFHQRYYSEVPGQVLEGTGRFLAGNVKVYVKSMSKADCESHLAAVGGSSVLKGTLPETVTLSNLKFEPPVSHLFEYLCGIEALIPLD